MKKKREMFWTLEDAAPRGGAQCECGRFHSLSNSEREIGAQIDCPCGITLIFEWDDPRSSEGQ